jgi:hypothetical protein
LLEQNNMKLTSGQLAIIVFVMLFGGIGFTTAMNWWKTETSKEPVRYTSGEASEQYNPADIRGSYTFGDINRIFGVPLADLQTAFRIPSGADPAAYPVKSLESQFADLPVEIGTSSVRMFVAFYLGLPYDLASVEETYLFAEAAEILGQRGDLRPEQAAYLADHIIQTEAVIVPTEVVQAAAPDSEPQAAPTEHAAPDRTLTGKTTFQDLLDWGVSKDNIEQALGAAMPSPQMLVKDYSSSQGTPFSELKGQLQQLVDQQP